MPDRAPRRDLRDPLVIDLRELRRRPGSMIRLRRTVPAPAGWVTPVVGVPEGTDLQLDLRLESAVEGVLVSGRVSADVAGECSRCLDVVRSQVAGEVRELFAYPGAAAADDEDVAGVVVEDRIDLGPVVRDAVVLGLPLTPWCRPDCPGLCPDCGGRLADLPADHTHDDGDPRWEALRRLAAPS